MHKPGLISFVFALILVHGSPASAQRTIALPSGKLVLKSITAMRPVAGKPILAANVNVPGGRERTREQLSVLADEFFTFHFGLYAEQKGFKAVAVSFTKGLKAGRLKFSIADAFKYNLQENGVWEPEHDSLKDNDPLPEASTLELPSGKQIFVESAGVSYLHVVRQNGWGSNYWSDVSFETDPRAVYAQSREYWNLLKDRIDPSLGVAAVFAFSEPRLGFFQFREYMYLVIRTDEKGDWKELPATLDEVMGQKSGLIQANFGPGGLKTVWPEH